MSFVVGTLHPPSIISSITTAKTEYDALILSRGNELLISNITDQLVSKPKIFQFFGNILSICSFNLNKLAVLFDTEKLLLFEITLDQLHCFNQCPFNYRIGRKVPKAQLSASDSLIICHTRVRTIQVIVPSNSLSFTQYLPFTDILTIKCFDNSMEFIIFGKNLQNTYQAVLYEVTEKMVNKVKSISFPDCQSKPFIFIESINKFYVSYDKEIELCLEFDKKRNFYTHSSDITSLFQIDDDTIALCDIKNKVFNISNQHSMLSLDGIDQIVKIGHDFFFELSTVNDSHLLKYENSILKVFDTFAQLNSTCFMDRSQLVTKSGIIRSFVNGSQTAEHLKIEIDCGKLIWTFLDSKFIAISTFDSTVVLETKKFTQTEMNFVTDQETLSIIELDDKKSIIQITPKQIHLMHFGLNDPTVSDVSKPTFSDTFFEGEKLASCVANYGNNFVVAFSDNSISFFTFSVENSEISFNGSFDVPHEVSSLAMNDSCLYVSFWQSNRIHTFDLETLQFMKEMSLKSDHESYASSLIYEPEDGTLIAGCSDGCIQIFKQDPSHKNESKTITIHVSNSPIKLKRIKEKILIVSDVSAMLHRIESNGDCEYKIELVSAPASFDAADFLNEIGFLSSKEIVFLSIESHHHSHIEDKSALFSSITLISVDETNHCPTVYSVKSNSKSDVCFYTLFASGCQPFKLNIEIPRCMIWFLHDSDYYLVVGCEFEKSGVLMLFNSKLEKVSSTNLSLPIDAICSVFNTYIAVASGTTLKGFVIDEDHNLVCKCSEQTRVKCASLTSPNSFAVVYADKSVSASIYKMVDDQITLIARDMNPKSLKFARLESETNLLAIGDNSIIYDLSLLNETKLKTAAAFNINCEVSAVFSSPNLTFITKSGSLKVIMKQNEILIKIYKIMNKKVMGIGGLTNSEFRKVEKNGNHYDSGCFVDGDFIQLFNVLSSAEQDQIARMVGISTAEIKKHINKYVDDLVSYREKSQIHPKF